MTCPNNWWVYCLFFALVASIWCVAGSKQNEGQEGNKSLSTVDKIMIQVRNESVRSASKITIVGCGQVGMAAAYSMMIQVREVTHHNLKTQEREGADACQNNTSKPHSVMMKIHDTVFTGYM